MAGDNEFQGVTVGPTTLKLFKVIDCLFMCGTVTNTPSLLEERVLIVALLQEVKKNFKWTIEINFLNELYEWKHKLWGICCLDTTVDMQSAVFLSALYVKTSRALNLYSLDHYWEGLKLVCCGLPIKGNHWMTFDNTIQYVSRRTLRAKFNVNKNNIFFNLIRTLCQI